MDQRNTGALLDSILSYIHDVLPGPPASRHSSGLSALPDDLLREFVSLLPVKDAARTNALSRRWRGVWHSAPLVLVDSDLLPAGTDGLAPAQVPQPDVRRVTSAVSRILTAHPGPFRCVHLVASYREESLGLLARRLQLLAVKGVQELVLAHRPLTFDNRLPADLFGMATLTRLYLGLWKLPDTAGLPHAASFPNLRELGLCTVVMECRHMDFILAGSPVLEILCIQANFTMDRLTLVGRSLRCVQMTMVTDLEIAVENAPHLERLIIWSAASTTGKCSFKRIKIGSASAPALSVLGYLDPEVHTLQVGNTIVKAGTRADPRTIVPSVKILGLKVCVGILLLLHDRSQAEICTNLITLQSKKTAETTGMLSLKFWEESGATECIRSHIKLMVFTNFRGDQSELCFLKFFLERAGVLAKLVIVYGKGCFSSKTEVNSRVKPLFDTKWASNCCSLLLFESAFAEYEEREVLTFERGSDFLSTDPFAFIVGA